MLFPEPLRPTRAVTLPPREGKGKGWRCGGVKGQVKAAESRQSSDVGEQE